MSLFLSVEHSGDPWSSPAVLPGGLLHFLQDPWSQGGRCGPGSALSCSADHVDVYEVPPGLRRRLHLLRLCHETSVGRRDQSVLLSWKQLQALHLLLLLLLTFTPCPVRSGQCVMLWWSSRHRLLRIPGMLTVITCSQSPGTLPRGSHRSAPRPPQTQHLMEPSSPLERLLR